MRAAQYEAIRAALEQRLVALESSRIGPADRVVTGATADGDPVGIRTLSVAT